MPKKPKVKIDDLLCITFWDHGENAKDALEFEVIGRLFDETRLAYKVKCWGYVSDVDRASDGNNANEHYYTIVKRAIRDIKVLK